MHGRRNRLTGVSITFVAAALAVPAGLAASDLAAVAARPTAGRAARLPADWRSRAPFAGRFATPRATSPADHVIELAAFRFRTDALVSRGADGERRFLEPDLGSFTAALVRAPFSAGRFDLFIVQAESPQAQVALRAWLAGRGLEILDYLPNLAYLVRLDAPSLALVRQRPEVFWVGLYQPAYRVAPRLDVLIGNDPTRAIELRARFEPGDETTVRTLAGTLQDLSGVRLLDVTQSERGWIVRATAPAAAARELASLPDCLWVEQLVPPELANNMARTSQDVPTGRGADAGPMMDVERVWAKGIRGEGQIAAAADTGLSTGDLATLHHDFGQQGSTGNPLRVIKAYALGRPTWDDDQATGGGHGTHTSGSLVGNGFDSGSDPASNTFPATSYAGTAPKADLVFQSIMDAGGGLGGLPSDLTTLFQAPYADGARVHSNSWGAPTFGVYDLGAQMVDAFAWANRDMVITFSAGNEGIDGKYYDYSANECVATGDPIDGVVDPYTVGSPATAKDCIAVGAAESYRPDFVYEYPEGTCTSSGGGENTTWGWFDGCAFSAGPIASDLMADNAAGMGAFSSRGPTDDGRIKPDLVAPGIAIISTRTDSNQAYEQWGTCNVPPALQPTYMTMGGTSMANPLLAGSAVLVRQYYVDGWHANNSMVTSPAKNPGQGFAPSAALVKATLINGAWDMAPGQYGTGTTKEIPPSWDVDHDLPNDAEGYGRVDLYHSLFPDHGWRSHPDRVMEVHDVTPGLATGGSGTYTFTVTSSANPLIVTLVWTDPYASTAAWTTLVNDLDLEVRDPSGTQYVPNRRDIPGSTADNLNTVEQVVVTSPATGTWSIKVKGTSVPGNGVPGTTTQPCALVVSGVHLLRFPLAVTRQGSGSGTVSSNPAGIDCGTTCAAQFDHDSSVTLTASATGFSNWRGACTGTQTTCQVTIDQALTVVAVFGSLPYAPGDVNGDGSVNVSDVFYLINDLFAGGPAPIGLADVNADGRVNVSDVFYLINFLFAGGPAPI